MVKPNAEPRSGDGLWLCGLSMADFEVPSQPTPIAQAANMATAVTLDLADALAGRAGPKLADEAEEQLQVEVLDLNEAAAMAWSGEDEDQDARAVGGEVDDRLVPARIGKKPAVLVEADEIGRRQQA